MRDVIAVCRSSKRSRPRVAAVLDTYLWRIGDRTWRGRASSACLRRISDDLRAVATKSTAVSVHDATRHHAHQEPLFFVGSRRLFTDTGISPISVSSAVRSVKLFDDDDLSALRLAAHFHDIGKGERGFQRMITASVRGWRSKPERFRHELLSAHLFDALTSGMSDQEALVRISSLRAADLSGIAESDEFRGRMSVQEPDGRMGLSFLDPSREGTVIGLIGNLILTHHRLPGVQNVLRPNHRRGAPVMNGVHVREGEFGPEELLIPEKARGSLWQDDAFHEPARSAARALMGADPSRLAAAGDVFLRTAMILADRAGSRDAVQTRCSTGLIANTRDGVPQDDVETHIRKVTSAALSGLKAVSHLRAWPSARCSPDLLAPQSGRFSWQTEAVSAASDLAREDGGLFGVLMAGTGSGKTRAGLAVAAAARKGELRVSACLGLRTLTKQTAGSYVSDGLVPAAGVRALIGGSLLPQRNSSALPHSEDRSVSALNDKVNHIEEDEEGLGADTDKPDLSFLRAVFGDGSLEERMLAAPVLVCTVDHLIPASSPLRTNHIAGMLRLIGSDVILDEVDQYSPTDLISLMRLCRLIGACGRNLFIMSATLPEELAFAAYRNFRAGRREFMKRTGSVNGVRSFCVSDAARSSRAGARFLSNFRGCLSAQEAATRSAPVLQRVSVLPPPDGSARFGRTPEDVRSVEGAVMSLHEAHRVPMTIHGRTVRVSVGAVKLTRIRDVVDVASRLSVPGSYKMCLHSSLPFFQRAMYERDISAALNRKRRDEGGVAEWVSRRVPPDEVGDDLIVIIICSPVIETGNDIDLDWAVCEPHDSRGLVQFAGRINRHRRKPADAPNLTVLRTLWDERRRSHSMPGLMDHPGRGYDSCPCSPETMMDLREWREGHLTGSGLSDLFGKMGVPDGGGVSPMAVHGDSVIPGIERFTRWAFLSWNGLSDLRDRPSSASFSRSVMGKAPFRGGPDHSTSLFWEEGGWKRLDEEGVLQCVDGVLPHPDPCGNWLYDGDRITASLRGARSVFSTQTTVSGDSDSFSYHPQLGMLRSAAK